MAEVKVLVIGHRGKAIPENLAKQICETADVIEDEIVFVTQCNAAYKEAEKHRATLKLVVLASSWSEAMFHTLLDHLRRTKVAIVAFFSNRNRYIQMHRMCSACIEMFSDAIESADKAIEEAIAKGKFAEAITAALSLTPAATAKSTA